jgi:hypothetical protein
MTRSYRTAHSTRAQRNQPGILTIAMPQKGLLIAGMNTQQQLGDSTLAAKSAGADVR